MITTKGVDAPGGDFVILRVVVLDGKVSLPRKGGLFLFLVRLCRLVSFPESPLVQTVASRLALLVGIGGLALLLMAGPGDDLRTTLGVVGLVGAGLLVGLGGLLKVLGYVEEGAADAEDPG